MLLLGILVLLVLAGLCLIIRAAQLVGQFGDAIDDYIRHGGDCS